MSKQFSKIEQRRKIFSGDDLSMYVTEKTKLPTGSELSSLPLRTCYLLTRYNNDGYKPGIIYILVEIDGNKVWEPLKTTERGEMTWTAPNIWKRLTPECIILHWDSPASVLSNDMNIRATWWYEIIVRKYGSAPESPFDGEIVGISDVWNQWSDNDFTGVEENKPGFVIPLAEDDTDYYFRVFAFAKSGKYVGSPSVKSSWTWKGIHEELQIRHPKKAFRVGDIFEMPPNICFTDPLGETIPIHAQIMDFNYNRPDGSTDPSSINSITFMTVEVLANMSFDNKELQYAKISDNAFKEGKKYFRIEEGRFVEYDPRAHGFVYGNTIPATYVENETTVQLKSKLYDLNPSIRYFENQSSAALPSSLRQAQSATRAGCGRWSTSNLEYWLTTKYFTPFDAVRYKNNTNTDFRWYLETSADQETWKSGNNGWYQGRMGLNHDLPPASLYSATYIDIPPFPNGFTTEDGQEFLSYLMHPYMYTILDQYDGRYVRNNQAKDIPTGIYGEGTDHAAAEDRTSNFFWLPSFEEIFGRRPIYGINGRIDTTVTANTHEGRQFAYFANNPNWKESRTKYLLDDSQRTTPVGWYLRSCDPTTVSRVFYVSENLPEKDTGNSIETTCTAHRYTVAGDGDEPVKTIGPAVCFTFT